MAVTDHTTSPLTNIDSNQPTDAAEAVKRARSAFNDGRTRSLGWRRDQLDGLVRMLQSEETALLEALAADLGKPNIEGWAADIGSAINEIKHIAKHMEKWAKPRKVSLPITQRPGRGEVRPEPLGVALIIAPWNYPVQLLVNPMAAALAAGNTVVAKPSELAPATSAVLARVIPRYVDPEAVVVVEGGVEVSTALLEQRVDHIFFTGSTRVGKVVARAAAEQLTPAVLELGGKSPAIVDASADLDVTAKRLAWGKWLNAGQTCIAPDYLLVTADVKDELIAKLRDALTGFAGGDPAATPDLGRIVNDSHFDRLVGLLKDHGGVVASGGRHDRSTRFFEPTLVIDPNPQSDLMTEEIFGPILPVITVDSVDAAVEFINERPKPLALYMFSTDTEAVDNVVTQTSSGGVCVNHTIMHIVAPNLPFGGVGDSGTGRYHGESGFETFSNLKSVMHRSTKLDPPLLYPPYSGWKARIIRRFM